MRPRLESFSLAFGMVLVFGLGIIPLHLAGQVMAAHVLSLGCVAVVALAAVVRVAQRVLAMFHEIRQIEAIRGSSTPRPPRWWEQSIAGRLFKPGYAELHTKLMIRTSESRGRLYTLGAIARFVLCVASLAIGIVWAIALDSAKKVLGVRF